VVVGCYSVELYCENAENDSDGKRGDCPDFWSSFPHVYTGETYGQCARQARRAGWVLTRDRRHAYCPKCSGKKKARSAG
jgi:hypothetical protein